MFRDDATDPTWTKYRACDATSAHWYSLEQFERYAGALIDLEFRKRDLGGTRQKTTVRDFIAQFRGMSATDKQKQVLQELGAAHTSLHRFFGSEAQVNHERMKKSLSLVQKHTKAVRPELLGVIGEESKTMNEEQNNSAADVTDLANLSVGRSGCRAINSISKFCRCSTLTWRRMFL